MGSGSSNSAPWNTHYFSPGYLDEEGAILQKLPEFARDRSTLVSFYRFMLLTRSFDEKAVALQRTGRLGTYASSLGQEAVAVGVASAMRADDVLLPSFREQGAQIVRGVSLLELLLYWGGDERGSNFANCLEDFPVCIPVASHCSHAAGVAFAFKTRGEERAAVCVCGDGATSKGDFYEAINLAGVWQLPAVFVVNNNQWAISVPRNAQTACETLAQKSVGAGIPGVQIDGNDVISVYQTVANAVDRARSGEGPTLVEAITYRLGDHTTADDASRYREDADVSAHWKADPLKRIRNHIVAEHGWTRDDEEALRTSCADQIEKAVEDYLASGAESPTGMFDCLFAELPAPLAKQRQEVSGGLEPRHD